MFSSFLSGGVSKFGFGRTARTGAGINIEPVQVHKIENSVEKVDRRLKHLLKLNHTNFSILYNENRFHNHTPHILGSAYLFNATPEHLSEIYEDAAANEGHEPWKDSPSEIALHDYRDFIGKRDYQRAWVDFFEDQLVEHGYDWKAVAKHFLFETGPKGSPNGIRIFDSLIAGLGHPLIHLGYAFELDSREVGMEAMGLAATNYIDTVASLVSSLSSETTSKNATANPLTYSTSNLFEVFARCNADTRLNDAFKEVGSDNLSRIWEDKNVQSIILEHCNAWKITDPTKAFEQSQRLAVAFLISTAPSLGHKGHDYGFDFFIVHCLTMSHAVRILIPLLEDEHHLPLLRQWSLIALAVYIAQLRPVIAEGDVANFDLKDRDWKWSENLAIAGKHKFDAHYVKGIRAMREAAKVWGDDNQWFLKAATRFAGEFEEWRGFS